MTATRHEVWLELASGSRVLVGSDLPDVPAANAVATHWKSLAERAPDELHETMPGSGCAVRGSAIVAVKAQPQDKPSVLASALRVPRPGVWL
jgi:hypothetical protein